MPSAVDIINNLKTTLENNAALASFCNTKWSKTLTVKKVLKKRTEITLDEFPIILITRPSVGKKSPCLGTKLRRTEQTIHLYCGFMQDDQTKSLDEIIEFEELLDDVLMLDPKRGGAATSSKIENSVNDEGIFHPVYFFVMDVVIEFQR